MGWLGQELIQERPSVQLGEGLVAALHHVPEQRLMFVQIPRHRRPLRALAAEYEDGLDARARFAA